MSDEQLAAERAQLAARQDVAMRAIELGMDLQADRDFLWVAAEALSAPLPDGWVARTDALGQTFFQHEPTASSSRTHPMSEHYRKLFFSLKLKAVGYRQLMLGRIDSTMMVDALAGLSEADAARMERFFLEHDKDLDGVISYPEFAEARAAPR